VSAIESFSVVDVWTPVSGLSYVSSLVELNGGVLVSGFNVTTEVMKGVF
jgi:hypothetical protein